MREEEILSGVEAYYAAKIREHGTTAQGVDWSSEASQALRFEKLKELLRGEEDYTLLDYGCGYGALLDHLPSEAPLRAYTGFDLSQEMLERARRRYQDRDNALFTRARAGLEPADFVVASGIFNVKLGLTDAEWKDYILATLDRICALALRGFAFNVLSLYSDAEKRREHLYYADPLEFFDRCKRTYSPRVALLHDYPLWEFTVLVRKETR